MSTYLFRLQCECGAEMKANVSYSLPAGIDPRAYALQAAAKKGWVYRNGRMGKSVITVVCPKCRPEPLVLEGDVAPADAVPCAACDVDPEHLTHQHPEDLAPPISR